MGTTIILFAALAIALPVVGFGVLRMQQPAGVGSEEWRDPAPLMFRLVRPVVNLFAHHIATMVRSYYLEHMHGKLHAAGIGYAIRPEEFIVCRFVGMGFGVLLFVYCYSFTEIHSSFGLVLLAAVIPAGYFYPDIWLRDAVKRRHNLMEKQFPFFLELLVLSMRAGLNFASALSHSVAKMPDGPVRHEFSRMLRDTRTGISRQVALANVAERVKLDPVTNFTAAVNQTEELGGELGNILISQAEQRRSERFRKAEKQANQAPVKMLAPLIGLLFPVTFIIIVFPIFIKARDSGAMGFLFK